MQQPLTWLAPEDPFPSLESAWGPNSEAPGLLAAGGSLTTSTLLSAYQQSIFPWFSDGQPILWWSPDPRMVLQINDFCLHKSLSKTIRKFAGDAQCEVRIDFAFEDVIRICANAPSREKNGTWIVPEMIKAYVALHHAGYAHSVEVWINGELQGGLYCVGIGKAVFGESMFSYKPDMSKIALAALVGFCREHRIATVDCQQNTKHLASLGAKEVTRADFSNHVALAQKLPSPEWTFSPLYWSHVLPEGSRQ
jgi:leucyl/phenylalanyl-tRNA--protein transferase